MKTKEPDIDLDLISQALELVERVINDSTFSDDDDVSIEVESMLTNASSALIEAVRILEDGEV